MACWRLPARILGISQEGGRREGEQRRAFGADPIRHSRLSGVHRNDCVLSDASDATTLRPKFSPHSFLLISRPPCEISRETPRATSQRETRRFNRQPTLESLQLGFGAQ